MSFKQTIKGTLLPKIPLRQLAELDTSAGSENNVSRVDAKDKPSTAQRVGSEKPFVKIAGQIVTGIETFTIDETGFIPTIHMIFVDDMGEFAGDYFPKTNLIMNVYIKSGSEKFKPIRCDFLITSMKSIPSAYDGNSVAAGTKTTYMVKGELYIPHIYDLTAISYPNMTSKSALIKICEELGLGFAENDYSNSDKMTWINTNMGYMELIKEIADHAYQNDDSFFIAFIDKYYYLNFIEVNSQLKIEEMQETFVTSSNSLMRDLSQSAVEQTGATREVIEDTLIYNYLTTEMQRKGDSNFVYELSLLSDHGRIVRNQGYKKEIYYYDHFKDEETPSKKFTNFFIEPLKSEDRDADNFLVPDDEALTLNPSTKWMCIDYGNTHREWNAARLLNDHNIRELDKLKLRAVNKNINFQVNRGGVVPLYVTMHQAQKLFKTATRLNNNEEDIEKIPDVPLQDEVPDEQLTGYYFLSGTKYHYDRLSNPQMSTELFLSRREWKPSKITE